MDRKVILASLKAITYASGQAYVALSKGDTAAYLNDLGSIEGSVATILAHDARRRWASSARVAAHAALSNKSAMTTAWPRIS
jgi:hypothetical protein